VPVPVPVLVPVALPTLEPPVLPELEAPFAVVVPVEELLTPLVPLAPMDTTGPDWHASPSDPSRESRTTTRVPPGRDTVQVDS